MKSKMVRGLLVAAVLCATVAIGVWLTYALSRTPMNDAATTLALVAAFIAIVLAAAAGVSAFNRSSR
ncbi:hypothetical protein [Microbacterium sp. NPDC055599]